MASKEVLSQVYELLSDDFIATKQGKIFSLITSTVFSHKTLIAHNTNANMIKYNVKI